MKTLASSRDWLVMNWAESGVCATEPGSRSWRNPRVANRQITLLSWLTGTPAKSARSLVCMLSSSGMHARIWNSASHWRHARISTYEVRNMIS